MRVDFDWDDGNDVKNYTKHGVSELEAESLFQDVDRLDYRDPIRFEDETRFVTMGRSNRPRVLFCAWTLRGRKARIISVRPASRKERLVYEEKKESKPRGG